MAAEVKRKMTNYEFLMSYSPPLSASQITEISQKITDLINTAITTTPMLLISKKHVLTPYRIAINLAIF